MRFAAFLICITKKSNKYSNLVFTNEDIYGIINI